MIELIKLGNRTYYLKNPVNIGIYMLDEKNVCVIDTGNSQDFGKMIDKVLQDNNWNLKYIINTHSHADHIGGNKYLQTKYNCRIFSNKIESYFINNPLLESAMLYSANPPKEMLTHFLKADESKCEDINNISINGIKTINLEGHSVGQIGIITSDNVCFCGDAYVSSAILNKYAIQYVYDIEKYLDTLDLIKNTKYKYYVPAHGEVEEKPIDTIKANINNIIEVENNILKIINNEISYTNFLKEIFNKYHIRMNTIQYHLISATIKSFLTKLEKEEKIIFEYNQNEMIIKII